MSWRFVPSLPLLSKELAERSARKRTYVLRVVFGALLYVLFGAANYETFNAEAQRILASMNNGLGSGAAMFIDLNTMLILGALLFVPAMAAGALTTEKERDSLALLFLTRLKPWQILAQKYLGALIPVLSLMLVALPLVAVTYSYGGIPARALWGGAYYLFLSCAQVAALALFCSALCRTTVAAFLATYFFGAVLYSTPLIICSLLEINPTSTSDGFWPWLCCLFPAIGMARLDTASSLQILLAGVPLGISTIVLLGLARYFLVRRAFVAGRSPLVAFFRKIDAIMQRLNRIAGSVQWGKERGLPQTAPVVWRELKQRALAQPRYQVRLLLAIEVPLIGLTMLFSVKEIWGFSDIFAIMTLIVGLLAVLVVSVSAANAFVSERVHQTLDVLLTTPLAAREIVRQKAQVLRRLIYLAAVPLVTLAVLRAILFTDDSMGVYYRRVDYSSALHWVCSGLNLIIYLPLVSWLSLWIGMRTRTRFRAIITALVVMAGWSFLPLVAGAIVERQLRRGYGFKLSEAVWLLCASPAYVPFFNETRGLARLDTGSPWLLLVLNFSFYALILFFVRWFCLRNADYYLRR